MGLLVDVTTLPIPGSDGIALVPRLFAVCGRPLVQAVGKLLGRVGPGLASEAGREALKADLLGNAGELAGVIEQVMDALASPAAAPLVRDLCRFAVYKGKRFDDPHLGDEAFNIAFMDDPLTAYAVALEVALARGLFSRAGTSIAERLAALKAGPSSPLASPATS